jgi:PhnB protein
MATVNIYLSFDGNCEQAFNFYKSVFGGEFTYMGRWSEMPPAPGMPPIADADKNKVMHVGLPISKETCLLGADFCAFDPSMKFCAGNNFSICITPSDEAEARKLFAALAVGGTITMPLEKQFWGSLNGMLVDKFGIAWMVDFALEQQ